MAFPFARVGPHGKARMSAPFEPRRGRRDRDPHVEGEHAGLVGEQRIDVELPQLGHVGGELRQPDEDERDLVDLRRGHVAVGGEQARDAGAADQVVGERQGRAVAARRALSLITSTPTPPWPNTITGPKVASSAIPAMSSRALGRTIIGCNDDAGDMRIGPQRLGVGDDLGGGLAHRRCVDQAEPHAADVGLVDDVAGENLDRDGLAFAASQGPPSPRPPRASSAKATASRECIGRADRVDLDRVEPGPAGRRDARRRRGGRRRRSGEKSAGKARRRLHQRLPRLAIADEVHEAAHRLVFGVVVGDAGAAAKVAATRSPRTEPDGEDRLRRAARARGRVERRRRRRGAASADGERRRHVHHQHRVVLGIGEQRLERGA